MKSALAFSVLVLGLFVIPCRVSGSAQESSSTVTIREASQDELLWVALKNIRDADRRDAIIREFHQRFPDSQFREAVCDFEFSAATEGGGPAEILAAAQHALDSRCVQVKACETALEALETSPEAGDTLAWVKRCHGVAREARERAAAGNKESVAAADALATRAEYRLFLMSWQASGAAAERYLAELRALNAQSTYVSALYDRALHEAVASGDPARAEAKAIAVLQVDRNHLEALLALAGSYLQRKQNLDQIVPLTARAINEISRREAQRGSDRGAAQGPDAAGDARLKAQRGKALWLQGIYFAAGRRWKDADITLRRALPQIAGDAGLLAAALYQLGLANSQLDRSSESLKEIRDAIRFLEQCAGIASPYQEHARQLLATLQASARN